MTVLLIAGSRHFATDAITAQAKAYTMACVQKALNNGWSLIAGDCYAGVDTWVAEAVAPYHEDLDGLPRLHLRVYGIQDTARHGISAPSIDYCNIKNKTLRQQNNHVHGTPDRKYLHVNFQDLFIVKDYNSRDRFMVHMADKVMCIWNGKSAGTQAVFNYAKANGFTPDDNLWRREFK